MLFTNTSHVCFNKVFIVSPLLKGPALTGDQDFDTCCTSLLEWAYITMESFWDFLTAFSSNDNLQAMD